MPAASKPPERLYRISLVSRALAFAVIVLVAGAATPADAQYSSRWDRIGGGWSTGWVPNHPAPVCHHRARGCNCFGRNYCGTYRSGQVTFWWPRGCRGPLWRIRCTSRRMTTNGGRAAFCRRYASTGVRQYQENLRRRCGFSGSIWRGDYRVHFNWCMRVSNRQANQGTQQRQAALNRCIQQPGDTGNKAAFCRRYANTGVRQYFENIRRRCGYRGSIWRREYHVHYNWCMRVASIHATRGTRQRQVLLNRCRR